MLYFVIQRILQCINIDIYRCTMLVQCYLWERENKTCPTLLQNVCCFFSYTVFNTFIKKKKITFHENLKGNLVFFSLGPIFPCLFFSKQFLKWVQYWARPLQPVNCAAGIFVGYCDLSMYIPKKWLFLPPKGSDCYSKCQQKRSVSAEILSIMLDNENDPFCLTRSSRFIALTKTH